MNKKKRKGTFYRDLEIPAKLFFDIMDTGDVRLLIIKGDPRDKLLDKAFENIFDKYYEKKNDGTLHLILKTRKRIVILYRKIGTIEGVLLSLSTFNFPEEDIKKLVEGLKKLKVFINLENNLNSEILKALQVSLAGMKTQLALEEHNLTELTKGKKQDFIDTIVMLEQVFEYQIDDKLTLGKYLSYQAAADRRTRKRKEHNKKK